MKRTFLTGVLLSGAVALCVVLVWAVARRGAPPYEFKTLDCGNDQKIVIRLGSLENFGYYPVYYQVFVHNRPVAAEDQLSGVGVWPGTKFDFELIRTEDGNLVGVILRPLVSDLAQLPDFALGECWTREVATESLIIVHDFKAEKSFSSAVGRGVRADGKEFVVRLLSAQPNLKGDTPDSEYLQAVSRLTFYRDRGNDSDLSHALSLPALETITCHEPVSAKGVQILNKMPRLKELDLCRATVTDDNVGKLAKLQKLETLCLPANGPSRSAIKTLHDALPGTKILLFQPPYDY